jgi:hypothetical protein
VTTTNRDYDLGEISKLTRGVYIGCAMMCFLHLYMKYTQPLFVPLFIRPSSRSARHSKLNLPRRVPSQLYPVDYDRQGSLRLEAGQALAHGPESRGRPQAALARRPVHVRCVACVLRQPRSTR